MTRQPAEILPAALDNRWLKPYDLFLSERTRTIIRARSDLPSPVRQTGKERK